jgi:hypothetical protein
MRINAAGLMPTQWIPPERPEAGFWSSQSISEVIFFFLVWDPKQSSNFGCLIPFEQGRSNEQ